MNCINKYYKVGIGNRLAVAVTSAKDADYYFFDEPSSYNDVYQRLAVAKVIQDLAKEGKSVMVVEHDMALLDYLSDYIHILYGEAGAYGIVSSLQSTKLGINNLKAASQQRMYVSGKKPSGLTQ